LKLQACSASGYLEQKVIEIDYNNIYDIGINDHDKTLILEFKIFNTSNRTIKFQSEYVSFLNYF
jgi:hypothetical protein